VASTPITLARNIRMRNDSAHGFMTYSRYANDFVEAGRLGKGGFGEVVRARNKLDGRFYAIKKITSNSSSALSDVLSELHFISRMNHPNVVRYYGSWVEEEGEGKTSSDTSESDDEEEPSVSMVKSSAISYGHSGPGLDFISEPSGADIQFGYDTDDDDHNSEAVADEDDDEDEPGHLNNKAGTHDMLSYIGRRRRSSVMPPSKSTLYIQMEYCEKQVKLYHIALMYHY
jgi:translation initiation factor 2-alpha kinase 4